MKIKRVRRPLVKQVIGMTDIVDFPELELTNVKAKIDTGAFTSALHCKDVRLDENADSQILSFCIIEPGGGLTRRFYSDNFTRRIIRNSFGADELRYVIKTRIKLFGRTIRTEFTLADRERMKNPVLLGRRLLRNRFVVDVTQQNLSYSAKLAKQQPVILPIH
jgi:hypothetical protein